MEQTKLKEFLTNAVEYNKEVLLKTEELLSQFQEKPEQPEVQKMLMFVISDVGKKVIRLSELVRVYDLVFPNDPLDLPESIKEGIKKSREDFVHLKGDDLIDPEGSKVLDVISLITKKSNKNE